MEKLPGEFKIARISHSFQGAYTPNNENEAVELSQKEIEDIKKLMGSFQKTLAEGEPPHQL